MELHLLEALLCPEYFNNLHGKILQAINSDRIDHILCDHRDFIFPGDPYFL